MFKSSGSQYCSSRPPALHTLCISLSLFLSLSHSAQEDLQDLFDYNIKTEKTTTKLLNDLVHAEEVVGQQILDLQQLRSQMAQEIESLKQEVQRRRSESQILSSELKFVLERLGDTEQEIQTLQQEVDEDTTESHRCVAQLYFKVTKVKLEVDTEPERSDDLWSLVNTEW
uniref:Uncharacterized protein n=1 Tax=Sinocyclocheilus anshuiensis TaxID=1608454 RepID=A0A671P9G7_9TELE